MKIKAKTITDPNRSDQLRTIVNHECWSGGECGVICKKSDNEELLELYAECYDAIADELRILAQMKRAEGQ